MTKTTRNDRSSEPSCRLLPSMPEAFDDLRMSVDRFCLLAGVPSIYSIVPPNDGSALRHGHHFEPVDFVIDHGRGHHDAYSAGSCQRAYARGMRMPAASTSPQRGIDRIRAGVVRPRGVRNDDADRRPWARKRPFRTRPAERVVHPVCPCRSTSGSLNRDNSRGMSQECAANAAR